MNDSRLGYACVNLELTSRPKKLGGRVTTSRTARMKTWHAAGLSLLGDLALANAKDLLTYLEWNNAHDIKLFRVGSELIPWHDHYEIKDLPQYEQLHEALYIAGEYARKHGIRLTTHPGPFHVLGSPNQAVADRSVIGLERHSEMFDMMGFEPSFDNKINIHIGGAYGDHASTAERWLHTYDKLSNAAKSRVVLENDDKASMWSVQMLYDYFHTAVGIPITFDYFHHKFHTSDLSEEEALILAGTTWPSDVRQCCHYSESRRDEYVLLLEDAARRQGIRDINEFEFFSDELARLKKIRETAHADYVIDEIQTYGLGVDIVLEAKAKEKALLKYRDIYSKTESLVY